MKKGGFQKHTMLENVKLPAAHLKKKTKQEAKGGEGREPRKLPWEDRGEEETYSPLKSGKTV